MTCTNIDCGNPAADLYLCSQCSSDLDAWIRKGRALIPDMTTTIHRLDNVRQQTSGGGGLSTGSKPPINLAALETRDWLANMEDARTYAADQMAARWAWDIQDMVTRAELMVSGPEPDRPKDTEEARRKLAVEVPRALHINQLVEWLKVTHGIELKPALIRKWDERKKITRLNDTGRPTYDPATVLIQARKEAA